LRKAGADNDEIAFIDPAVKLMISRLMGDTLNELFWEQYTLEKIIDVVQETIGTPSLPELEAYAWLQAWVERQPLSAERKAAFQEEIANIPSKFNGKLIQVDGKFNRGLIRAMLTDMGILQIPPPRVEEARAFVRV
jgi:hypothetical protein